MMLSICLPLFASPILWGVDRRFEVQDSIHMAKFSRDRPLDWSPTPRFSPDGKYVALITFNGDIEHNAIESDLWLFKTSEIINRIDRGSTDRKVTPVRLFKTTALVAPKISAGTEHALISNIHWDSSSQHILFLVQNSEGDRRLFRSSVIGRTEQLTPDHQDVRQFDLSESQIAYLSTRESGQDNSVSKTLGDAINAGASDVTGLSIAQILFHHFGQSAKPNIPELWVIHNGARHRIKTPMPDFAQAELDYPSDAFSLSSTGTQVVRLVPTKSISAAWQSYEPASPASQFRIRTDDPNRTSASSYSRLREYAIVDLARGTIKPLIDAPAAWSLGYSDTALAVWTQDSRRLLLSNTFLPLDSTNEFDRAKRRLPCAVAAIDMPSHKMTCIVFSRGRDVPGYWLTDAHFGSNNDEVILQFRGGNDYRTECYRNIQNVWTLIATTKGLSPSTEDPVWPRRNVSNSISISIAQTLNSPPALWGTNNRTGASTLIWDPNPQLRHIRFGEASVFLWKDQSGYEWKGGLIKPVGYVPGKRYPLVIQTHGFDEKTFLTDGPYTTAMAARPLASAGFVVLQLPSRFDHKSTPQEPLDFVLGFKSAIDQLTKDGLVDPTRVGVIGFSRTCWYVETALTKEPSLFAVATLADGIDNSYMQYMTSPDMGTASKEYEDLHGGRPFGTNLAHWMEASPTSHLDQVGVPLRVEAIGPESLLYEWEIYSSLTKQNKPVDLVYIPNGEHVLRSPLDRMASQQGNVDWFRFWLQGVEDSNPRKSSQYSLWRRLRQLQMGPHSAPIASEGNEDKSAGSVHDAGFPADRRAPQ